MVNKFRISYYKNWLWVTLAKGGGCPVGFDIRAKTFLIPKRMCFPVANGSHASYITVSGYLFKTISEICTCYSRLIDSPNLIGTKVRPFPREFEKRPTNGTFQRAGATLSDGPTLSRIAFKDSRDEILVVFKLIEDGRQNGLSPVFKTGCRPFLRVFDI
jgi:hypothetical protein